MESFDPFESDATVGSKPVTNNANPLVSEVDDLLGDPLNGNPPPATTTSSTAALGSVNTQQLLDFDDDFGAALNDPLPPAITVAAKPFGGAGSFEDDDMIEIPQESFTKLPESMMTSIHYDEEEDEVEVETAAPVQAPPASALGKDDASEKEAQIAAEKAAKDAAEKEAKLKAEKEAAEKAAKEAAEKAAAEKVAKEAAEKAAAEKAAKEAVEKAAAEKVAKEAAEKAAAEEAARLEKEAAEKAAKEAVEKAAKEAAEREASEKAEAERAAKAAEEEAARIAAEKEAAEKAVQLAAEKEAAEKARLAAEKAAAEKEAAEIASRLRAEKEAEEKAAKEVAEKEAVALAAAIRPPVASILITEPEDNFEEPDSSFDDYVNVPAAPIIKGEIENEKKTAAVQSPVEHVDLFGFLRHVPPSAMNLIYWRCPLRSGVALGVSLSLLISFAYFSVISVLANAALIVLVVSFAYVGFKKAMAAIQKTNDGHPFKDLLATPPKELIPGAGDCLTRVAKEIMVRSAACALHMRHYFLVVDVVDSLKFGLALYLMTYLGEALNLLTLVTIGVVLLFSLPKIYEVNKKQIDAGVEQIMAQIQAQLPVYKALIFDRVVEMWRKVAVYVPGVGGGARPVETAKDK